MKTYTIKTKVTHIKLDDGREFDTYKAVQKDGKIVDLKFTRDVKNLPTEDCYIVVAGDKINLAKKREYPCFWVKEVSEIIPFEKQEEDLTEYFE